jgi:hypothetical protein
MQKNKTVKKSATLKLNALDTTLQGVIKKQDDNGFWLTVSKEVFTKLLGPGPLQHEADVFIPFSSVSWLVVEV